MGRRGGWEQRVALSGMDWFSRSPALISSSGVMHYPSDHISHAGARHLTRACMGVMWGCWQEWPDETVAGPQIDREWERESVGLKSDTQKHWLGGWLLLLSQPVRASLSRRNGSTHTKTLSGSLHRMWSKHRKTNSKCSQELQKQWWKFKKRKKSRGARRRAKQPRRRKVRL